MSYTELKIPATMACSHCPNHVASGKISVRMVFCNDLTIRRLAVKKPASQRPGFNHHETKLSWFSVGRL